jgi:hypothetical protein
MRSSSMEVEVDAGTLLPTCAWGVTWSEKDGYAVLFPQTQEIPPEAAALIGAFMRLTVDAAFREECADWLTEYRSH